MDDTFERSDPKQDLICGVDRELIERFLMLIRDNYKKVDMASFFLESRSGIANVQGMANMRDMLSHLVTMLDARSAPNERSKQLAHAEEHLRRAIVEPYEMAINKLLVSFNDLYDVYKAKVLLARDDYPDLANAPTSEVIETQLSKVTSDYQKGRAAKSLNLWDEEFEEGMTSFVKAYDNLLNLKTDVETYWNKFVYLEQQGRKEGRPKKSVSSPVVSVGRFGIPGEDVFDTRLSEAAKQYQTISSLFLDLDNFKSVNDNYDLATGDLVIREAISLIQKIMAGKGELFHRSGDEILVLLNNFTESEACSVGERIRREMESNEFSVIGRGVVTATIGVSTYPDPCSDWRQLQVTADQAAMTAKKLGKNQVLHYSEKQQGSRSTEVPKAPTTTNSSGVGAAASYRSKTDLASSDPVEALAEVLINMINERPRSAASGQELEKLRKIYKLETEINQLKSTLNFEDQKGHRIIVQSGGVLNMSDKIDSGDNIQVSGGQVGAIGRGAHVHDITFNQVWREVGAQIDLPALANELEILIPELRRRAGEASHDKAVLVVGKAAEAAKQGHGPQVLQYLQASGKWVFNVATDIGVRVAAEVINKALQLGSP